MKKRKSAIVIPARWGSKRLPGKPLIKIAGKPLICRVVENALRSKLADKVIVVTDNNEIKNIAEQSGAEGVITKKKHENGTERILEIIDKYVYDYYINLQGDEPFINPKDVDEMINKLNKNGADIISICTQETVNNVKDPNKVKVVFDKNYKALYFSRSNIPYGSTKIYKHIGIYGFSFETIQKIKNLPKAKIEEYESLEQLRWIHNGLNIKMQISNNQNIGIDTKEDLEIAENMIFMKDLEGIISDVDGVLTDGKLYYGQNGEELKLFNVHDGLAIKSLMKFGLKIGLISSRNSKALRCRAEELGIRNKLFGLEDKAKGCNELIKAMGVKASNCIYIGDDINDIKPSKLFGKKFAVADASKDFKQNVDKILKKKGGEGVFQEVYENINFIRKNEEIL